MNDKELLEALKRGKTELELDTLRYGIAVGKLAGLLHTVLCPLDHEKDCDFYIEEVSTTISEARREWGARAYRLLEKANITQKGLEEILESLPLFLNTKADKVQFLKFLTAILPALISVQGARLARTSSSQSDPLRIAESLGK